MNEARRPTIVQVVRRFGRVGGMETYVWHLATELAALGEQVVVVCETCHEAPGDGVQVLQLGQALRRPRWIGYAVFSARVSRALTRSHLEDAIVHSHERCADHHVTTFHSEPFNKGVKAGWIERFSPRKRAYRWMEAREVQGTGAREVRVVPVSGVIEASLRRTYPAVAQRIGKPISPGVEPLPPRAGRHVAPDGGVIGFVGQEWRRKGLEHFLKVAAILQRRRPAIELLILGPSPAEIEPMCRASGVRYRCLGWVRSRDHYASMDVLMHPASSEAYGMVIPEALASGIPVVVSHACGAAADVPPSAGSVLSLADPPQAWADACDKWLHRQPIEPVAVRRWRDVALDYQALYRSLLA